MPFSKAQQWGVPLPNSVGAWWQQHWFAPSYDLRNVKKVQNKLFSQTQFQLSFFYGKSTQQKQTSLDKLLMHRKVLIDVKLQAQWLKWKKMRSMVVSISKVRATIIYSCMGSFTNCVAQVHFKYSLLLGPLRDTYEPANF